MTNTHKHTPAPWRAKLSGQTVGKSHIIHDDAKYPSGMFGLCHVFGDTLEQEHANARLIAGAPEMLQALYDAREALRETGGHRATLRIVEAAINKATKGVM